MANIGLIGIWEHEPNLDFWTMMRIAADLGYKGVESVPDVLREGDWNANMTRLRDMGLQVLTVGASRERLRDELDTVLGEAADANSSRVTVWWGPCDSKEQLLRDAELYNEAGRRLAEQGIQLCYHNHHHEFLSRFDGIYGLDILVAHTDPNYLQFELDIAWITAGGENPANIIARMADRVPAIHVKDMLLRDGQPLFTGFGTGIVDIQGSLRAATEAGVDWFVVEQDRLRNLSAADTLTFNALYLKESGYLNEEVKRDAQS